MAAGAGGASRHNVPVANIDGIFLNNCSESHIKDCTIRYCKGNGVWYFATESDPSTAYGNWIEGCYVYTNWGGGIRTSANSGLIQNNQVVNNGHGIWLVSDDTNGNYGASINMVSNNSVRLNGGNGIFIDSRSASGTHGNCSQNVISDNLLSNNGGDDLGSNYNLLADGSATMWNLITGNHCSSWAVANMQDMYITAVTHDNFIIGNLVSHTAYVVGNNCAKHNLVAYNNCG